VRRLSEKKKFLNLHQSSLNKELIKMPFRKEDIFIEINGNRFKNRFAWLQDPTLNDMIIGREIVFDMFNIEFRQADEQIIFEKR